MNLWSLTMEHVQQLKHQQLLKSKEMEELDKTDPAILWERDIDSFLTSLDEQQQQQQSNAADDLFTKPKPLPPHPLPLGRRRKPSSSEKNEAKKTVILHPKKKLQISNS